MTDSTTLRTEVVAPTEINKGDLLAAGWTEGAIKRFLPQPTIRTRKGYRGRYTEYLYDRAAVELAEEQSEVQQYLAMIKARREKRASRIPQQIPLLDAIREVSRAAHRWRDASQAQYWASNHGLAGHSKRQKLLLYQLKEQGIAAAYGQGLLRYAGCSPQGMAVYEYGRGGKESFHSYLHPVGVPRTLIEGHPETLLVAAKAAEHSMADAKFTLGKLPQPSGKKFERTAPLAPRVECYECGEDGHVARECRSLLA